VTVSIAFRIALGLVLAGVVPHVGWALATECPSNPIVELPMVQNDLGSPIVSILIDNRPRDALIDTGGFWSMLSPSIAKLYGTRKSGINGRLGLEGVKIDKAVTVPSIQIGPVKVPKVDFFEAPEDYSENAVTLGANWLSRFDVEIDPVGAKVTFFPRSHCGSGVVYWPHSDFAELPVRIDRDQNLVTIPLILDGREIHALIDTGAPETYLSLRVAEALFGLKPDSPGMQAAEPDTDQNGQSRQMYRRQFASMTMGGIVIPHPWMVISPMTDKGPDMILGMHQLSGFHLYFAYGERKLYATSAGGDIAAHRLNIVAGAALPTPRHDPVALTNAREHLAMASEALKRNDYDGASAALERAISTAPEYAPVYVQRAELFAARGWHDRAIADLDRALRLDPNNASGLLARSQIYIVTGDYDRALADANRAIALDPGSDEPHAVRAEAYAAKGIWDRAMQDSTYAIRLDPKSISGWLTRSHVYELTGDYDHALADADQAVRLEPRSASALNSRCWTGAILARLDAALSDCNAAVAIRPYSAEILDSRAFVHLKAGRLEAAVVDYSAALKIDPSFASSLYGRGLAKQRMGDRAGGEKDIAAALKSDAEIARNFGK
jgi:tetratricopeptide (TPR) repeat protein/predicted aspartyl protease